MPDRERAEQAGPGPASLKSSPHDVPIPLPFPIAAHPPFDAAAPARYSRSHDRRRVRSGMEGLAVTISRKGFLQGMGCAAAGAAVGALAGRRLAPGAPPPPVPPPRPMNVPPRGEDTFAQAGEDRIVLFILEGFGVRKI